ncbi:hypothetical protein [Terrisporobacter petrolearius]|uniref:hypothetical protein n=1 Tax=Terrisporobacter petrolearius TaxID=1460447 RepID=UPI0031CCD7CB
MDLDKAIKDYETKQFKKHLRFRKCSNCEFCNHSVFHDKCKVKNRNINYDREALACRYYKKNK